MYIALCDDSKEFLEYERSLIGEFMTEHGIESCCDLFESGEELLQKNGSLRDYALFILDYDMEGLTGFDTAKRIYEIFPEAKIAFATNYYDFTREGYRYNAIRYLVKQETTFKLELYECICAAISVPRKKKTVLQLIDRSEEIDIDDISFISSDKHYIEYHFYNDRRDVFLRRCSLDDVIKELPDYFVRVHQRYIVNIKKAAQIKHQKTIIVKTECADEELPVARNRYDSVYKRFCLLKGDF